MFGRNVSRFFAAALVATLAMVAVAGCGGGATKRSADDILRESGKSRANVAPLAGTITVDGQVPDVASFGKPRLVVLLFEKSKLDESPDRVAKVLCDPKGQFVFSTYDQGDGVPPGQYVLAFVEMKFDKKRGYFGKDLLKNLYSDPSINEKNPELVIDHQPPGKKDYVIDLKIAGRDAATPGPHAVTKLH